MNVAPRHNPPDCADEGAQSDGHRDTAGRWQSLRAGEVKLLTELGSQSPEGNGRGLSFERTRLEASPTV